MSERDTCAPKIAARLALTALLVTALVGFSTWGVEGSVGRAAERVPGPRCSIAALAMHICDAAITRLPSPAPAVVFSAGETIGRIVVPRMSLDSPVVEMENCQDDENLNKGPGHIKGTALPGASGNCVIAGHRSTCGRPFSLMGSIQAGDEIILMGLSGTRYVYRVSRIWVVSPADVWVLDTTPEPSVTLITCHPPGSDASRLIVRAVLER